WNIELEHPINTPSIPYRQQEQEQEQEQEKEQEQNKHQLLFAAGTREQVAKKSIERKVNEQGGEDEPQWPSPEAFVALYNAATPEDHPKVKLLSPERQKHIEQYVAMFPDRAFWEQVYAELS